jgi:hypothetical protein
MTVRATDADRLFVPSVVDHFLEDLRTPTLVGPDGRSRVIDPRWSEELMRRLARAPEGCLMRLVSAVEFDEDEG